MAKILNSFLCAFGIFFICFAWVYYSLKDDTLALALAVIVALCSAYLIWKTLGKIDTGKQIKIAKKKAVANFIDFFRFGADNAAIFQEVLRYYHFEIVKQTFDSLIVDKNGKICYVAIDFCHDSLTRDALREAVVSAKRANCNHLYIFTNKVDAASVACANTHINTTFIDADNTYALFEQCDKLPSIPKQSAPKKASYFAQYAFNKRRFGWYFASSLFMLIISLISYFPWYALAWATIFFALAVYSLINKRYNYTRTRVTLD